MPISDWFSRREQHNSVAPSSKRPVPDGVWAKCSSCNKVLYQRQVAKNFKVCPHCQHHFEMSAPERLEMLVDEGTFVEMDAAISTADPLQFVALKTYGESIEQAREKTGLTEAIVTGTGTLGQRPVVVGVMDFRFIGGSMGSGVGEKVARAFEHAAKKRLPVVMVCASGGARMQEGMLSLMQMAKTSAAVARFRESRRPFISILSDPTSGGVTASFATLADVIIAEPGAFVGFTGPRVIEDTIRQKLPQGFQRAEFLLEHGMVDMVLPRELHRETLTRLLDYLGGV
ncbi:MAG: acetyl-CoA carboxylase carboxyltransferase subunit beta [Actinobacteria bacterium]|nr:MAG: acetyl-CoA carboxylase carboxyltransferase subunit beta [Actinomycetota bacterium]